MQALRQTIRTLWRDKAFSAAFIVMFALGVGAMTAIFSVVNTVVLRSAYADPERLFVIEESTPKLSARYNGAGAPVNARHLDEWRSACTACAGLGLMQGSGANLDEQGAPERIQVLRASHDLIPTLGYEPSRGRSIQASDDAPGSAPVLLLTDSFWRRRFQADPAVVGRDIQVDGGSVRVIGVLPPSFEAVGGAYLRSFGMSNAEYDAVAPAKVRYAAIRPRGNFNYGAVARLEPGATPEQAEAQMNAAIQGFVQEFDYPMSVRLRPIGEAVLGEAAAGLWMLLAAVGGVLLIVCVNLGNLMLVRVERRKREAGVRRALGATSGRLLGQVLKEGACLALLGAAGGLAAAQWAIEALVWSAPAGTPRLEEVRLDAQALVFAIGVSSAAGLITSLAPALRYARASIQATLREAAASAAGSVKQTRSRSTLIAAEVALSAVLLVTAGLLGASFFELMTVEKGFRPESVFSFDIGLPRQSYPEGEARVRFHEETLRRLTELPGVCAVGLTNLLPLEGSSWGDSIRPEGSSLPLEEQVMADFRFVSPGYLDAIGIPLVAGRRIGADDRGRRVAMVSRSLARRVWPGEDAIGKRFAGGPGGPGGNEPLEVVGVVADVHASGLGEALIATVYVSYPTNSVRTVSYAVRSRDGLGPSAKAIRETIWSVDPALPVINLRTMDQVVAKSVAQPQFHATLAALFAVTALLLAALGIYGVVSYVVANRTGEIGLRMALGARASSVVALVLSQGMRPVLAGLAIGLAAAAILGRYLRSMLFEVSATEPFVFVSVGILLLSVALFACYLPARRASRVDPLTALRHE